MINLISNSNLLLKHRGAYILCRSVEEKDRIIIVNYLIFCSVRPVDRYRYLCAKYHSIFTLINES